ncbi:hypothetical protein ACF1AX_31250 [Streptomyces sp. NPDC014802]|uniref:hypothetical protein n=1 Tax=Streptomyces sp. NPDC014802 TaxID=3364917 RepID=UPI0036FFCCC4
MIAPAAVQALQDVLVAHLRSRKEWDELPALFTVHETEGHGVRLVTVPVPDLVWAGHGHPPTAVASLAAVALQLPRYPDGSHLLAMPRAGRLIGAAFRYEAYALSSDSEASPVQEAVRRRSVGGSVPRFRDIPGRVEQRCMTAVDLDGGRYMASSSRLDESTVDATEPIVAYLAFDDPKRDKLTGKVVDATNRFLNAIKPVPDRRAET